MGVKEKYLDAGYVLSCRNEEFFSYRKEGGPAADDS